MFLVICSYFQGDVVENANPNPQLRKLYHHDDLSEQISMLELNESSQESQSSMAGRSTSLHCHKIKHLSYRRRRDCRSQDVDIVHNFFTSSSVIDGRKVDVATEIINTTDNFPHSISAIGVGVIVAVRT
ncbi:hypothetical protein TSAR_006846 [Trichomalopsis sarcophagae]|uniref:Uncharacterized protein n=1 Tax=Trichomalopsis sarcophagae TaxID=543379 RepID=A0A232EZ85_9HYME|nr:hypothetical protein TSAR_006846 [Trichomalopsis sarcophagae]